MTSNRSSAKVQHVTGKALHRCSRLQRNAISNGMDYTFALRANPRLRRFESWIARWSKLDNRGRVMGMLRNVGYYGETTNLVIIKDAERTYLYTSSIAKWPRYVWKRFCRRGNHERRHGIASTMGIKSLPSNRLFQIEGGTFSYAST